MKVKIFLFFVFLLAFVIRIIFLGSVPLGITDDEASVAYDTFLLSQSGRDQWGNLWPLEFKSFGDYRPPLYQYILLPWIKIFGLKNWVIRLPSAIFGSLSIFAFYFLIQKVFSNLKQKEILGIIAVLILAINPWHFGMSRWIMEANVALFFSLLAVAFFLRDEKYDWILSAFFSSLCFYTYYSLRFFLPFILIFLFWQQKWSKKKIFNFLTLGFLFCLPIFINIIRGSGSLNRIKQTSLINDIGLAFQSSIEREACLADSNLNIIFKRKEKICSVLFNRPLLWFRQFWLNYFNHFSFNFLFFEKFERAWQFLPNYAFFYLLDLPFFLLGFILSHFKTKKEAFFLDFWLLLAPLIDSLTSDGHYARSFQMIVPLIILISLGYLFCFDFLRQKRIKLLFLGKFLLISFYGFCVLRFLVKYFTYLPIELAKYSHYIYNPLFAYLKEEEKNFDNIFISRRFNDQRQYIFYLYYNQLPAKEYFSLVREYQKEANDWIFVKRLGKYYFLDNVNEIKKYPPRSLLLVSPQEIDRSNYLRMFVLPNKREILFKAYKTDEIFNSN